MVIPLSEYVLVTPELAGVSKSALGTKVANIGAERGAIISALDLLVTGG